ncbi:MAG: spore cortex biosynthesis protein YabQ [Peptococcales bacterium]|jgi:spore cortex biosynthesis protein YabQ
MQSIYDQLFAFLVTISIGFLAGILFDIYRVFRGLWQPRKLGTFLGDLLFWISMTVIVFTLLLIGNWGEIRIYVFIGMGLGSYFYIKFLSKRWQRISRKVFIFLIKIFGVAWKIISWPFKMIFKALAVPVGFTFSGLAICWNFCGKSLKRIKERVRALVPKKRPPDEE